MTTTDQRGASQKSIQHHYDVSNRFYSLWLDESMTYSCALWDGEADDLATAQLRKIDYLVAESGAPGCDRVLDIGCGWGSVMQRLVADYGVQHVTGLTLSEAQAHHVKGLDDPRIEVLIRDWADFLPGERYDAAISIGAMEHFVKFGWQRSDRVAAYRRFFEACHQWLNPGAGLTLQTIGKGNVAMDQLGMEDCLFIAEHIFPESDPPRLAEIAHAAEKLFEIRSVVNHREHYARTCSAWLDRLHSNRNEAVQIVGEDKVAVYERYLEASVRQFRLEHTNLYRISLRRV